jgi:hypothetical protein
VLTKLRENLQDQRTMKMVHGWLAVFWLVAAFPIMIFWSQNVPFLVFISVYAVVTGHWASYQAAEAEEKQDG